MLIVKLIGGNRHVTLFSNPFRSKHLLRERGERERDDGVFFLNYPPNNSRKISSWLVRIYTYFLFRLKANPSSDWMRPTTHQKNATAAIVIIAI